MQSAGEDCQFPYAVNRYFSKGVYVMKVVLVYQAGIANVFTVDKFTLVTEGRNAIRYLQSDFATCVAYCRGIHDFGAAQIRVAGCNMVGDIANQTWTNNLEDLPFSDKFTTLFDELCFEQK